MQQQKRDKWLNVRLSKAEHELIKKLAYESHISFSGYVRAALLSDPKAIEHNKALASSLDELRQIHTELKRQGNNFNQIAHRLNMYRPKDSELSALIEELTYTETQRRKTIKDITKCMKAVLK